MNMNKQQGDYDKALEHQAGEGNDLTNCFFCDKIVHIDDLVDTPEGASKEIEAMYLSRPRCLECETEMHGHRANQAKELFNSFVTWLKPEACPHPGVEYGPSVRSEDEKAALDEIYAEQDNKALTELDIDRLHQEKGDGRFWP